MEKNLGMVGMGKVTNGVMTFVDATGKGFAKKISSPVIRREPAVQNEVLIMKEEVVIDKKPEIVLNVPEFMKNRVKPEPMGQVIHVNFKKDEAKEETEKEYEGNEIPKPLADALRVGRKIIVKNPVFKYFFGEEE